MDCMRKGPSPPTRVFAAGEVAIDCGMALLDDRRYPPRPIIAWARSF